MGRSIRFLLVGAGVSCAIATVVLAAILAAPSRASAQNNAERITSYDARIVIEHNGSILVTEQITYDFGTDQRHGIFRVIPVQFRYNGRYDRIDPIDVRSVWSDAPNPSTRSTATAHRSVSRSVTRTRPSPACTGTRSPTWSAAA